MFGLTEFTALSSEPSRLAIIPTFILPFTILGMALTSLATWVAAFFGIKLKAEGPKRLFEVLIKPKVLVWTLISNLIFYGAYAGGKHVIFGPRPFWLIEVRNADAATEQTRNYSDFQTQLNVMKSPKAAPREIQSLDLIWQTNVEKAVFGGVVLSGSSLFMGTDAGKLIELDARTGKKRREFWTGQPIMTTPLILDGSIYFGEGVHENHHARYYKYDLKTGKMASAYQTQGHIERTATLANINGEQSPILLIPSGSDGINAVDAQSMRKLWQAKVGHVDSFPISDGERVFAGTGLEKDFPETGTQAMALSLKTGEPLWKKNLPTSAWGRPILWSNLVCFSLGDVYTNTHYGQLSCYDKINGTENFSINLPGAILSQPTLIDDKLVLSDLQGTIYQLNLSEKKIDWQIQTPNKDLNFAAAVVDHEDHIFMPNDEGLSIFSRQTQNLLYQWKPSEKWTGAFANITFVDDLWVLADAEGIVRAFRPRYRSNGK